MGKPVVRVGDMCSGHTTYPPRMCDQGSSSMMVDGKMVTRQSDHWAFHGNHDGFLIAGSSTVMIEGKPLARVGDAISCGSKAAQGSPTVLVD